MDTVFVHKMWDEQEILKTVGKLSPYPLLTDNCACIGKQYDVFDEDEGINLRGSFIIDPEGIVQNAEVLAAPVGRNFDEALRQIQALQLVRESNGCQVAPAAWTPGKTTLNPGAELVGKVHAAWKLGE